MVQGPGSSGTGPAKGSEQVASYVYAVRLLGVLDPTGGGGGGMVVVGGNGGRAQSTYIYIPLEYHSVCPLVRIGMPPPPLPQASVPIVRKILVLWWQRKAINVFLYVYLNLHKNENIFGSDFEICTFS